MSEQYALYKGEELLSMGTIPEIAKETGVKEETVRFYRKPAYLKRINKKGNTRVLVELDD